MHPQTKKEKLKSELFIPSPGWSFCITFAGTVYQPAYRDGNLLKSGFDPTKLRKIDLRIPVKSLEACSNDIKIITT